MKTLMIFDRYLTLVSATNLENKENELIYKNTKAHNVFKIEFNTHSTLGENCNRYTMLYRLY
jgi:hypothetical protein